MGKVKEYYYELLEMSEAEENEYCEWIDKNLGPLHEDEEYLEWMEKRAQELEDADLLQSLKDEELIEMIELKKMGA
jgi:hypothetical protein